MQALIVQVRVILLSKKLMIMLLLLLIIPSLKVTAQEKHSKEKEDISVVYDEIPLLVTTAGLNDFYLNAIYTNENLPYFNIEDLFQALNIPCIYGQNGNRLSGFIDNESKTYLIDFDRGQIKVGDIIIEIQKGLIKEMGTFYMDSSLIAVAFGINLTFDYSSLSVTLKSNFELSIVKEYRLEKIRNNMSKIKGLENVDVNIQRNYHLFRFGMLDWSVSSFQTLNGSYENNFGLGIGTEFLYGQANVFVNYYDKQKFDNNQINYMWSWVDNDKTIIKQAQIGKITSQTISFISSPLIGAVIRNSPTTIRKATGDYTIHEYTQPNWNVELYINDVLVDFTKADASGLYVFKIPIVYGYTILRFKFYGPLGEERTDQRTMNVPYTVMPANEFEYGLTAGIVQDSNSSRFGKSEFNYGVNSFITFSGGVEYLSSNPDGTIIPFINTTIQPLSKLTITGEYVQGVKSRGLLDYYFWKDALLEIDFTKYVEGQRTTLTNALEERRFKIYMPFNIGLAKIDYTQYIYKDIKFEQTNLMLSAYYKQFYANSTTQFNWFNNNWLNITSNLSLSYRMSDGYTISPSVQYNINENKLMTLNIDVEKNFQDGNITVSYERNLLLIGNFVSLNFKYNLSFARTNISTSNSYGNFYASESAQGSLAFGSGNNYIHANKNSSVGKGGISLYPFLDLNQNGIFDKDEHFVKLESVGIFGGNVNINDKDSIVRITELNSFTDYIMEFNIYNLDNIAWWFKYKSYRVMIDPNQFKRIDIPIIPVGEISGTIFKNKDSSLQGIGRILVKIYEKDSTKVVAETISEPDGFIDYMGLAPGKYVAKVDSVQLHNLDLKSDPSNVKITIKAIEAGDIVDGVDFVLNDKKNKDMKNISIEKYNNQLIWGSVCTEKGNYYVQCGAFKNNDDAMKLALNIKENTEMDVGIVKQKTRYKVRVECLPTKSESFKIKKELSEKGICSNMLIVKKK
jgi:hypothetical protein